ncbi:MAG: hypothetical protein V2B18_15500 [Pseudomonadota bacterium]
MLRETAVLLSCLTVPPSILGAILFHAGKLDSVVRAVAEAIHGLNTGSYGVIDFYILWALPYLVVQGFRGHLWARRSRVGRQTTYSLYAVGLLTISGKALAGAFDLLYLMWALDDLPGELLQFFELETRNLSVAVAVVLLAALCLKIAWGRPGGTKRQPDRSSVREDTPRANDGLEAGTH